MAKLVSMKIAKGDRDAKLDQPSTFATEGPLYPWGMAISLDDDALEKLGWDIKDFTVGATLTLIAKVEVTSLSSNESQGQDARQNVGLQITDCCLEDGAKKAASAASALYDKGE
ncbi:MAG TPA: hypothetical protein VKR23_15895 [Gaiellaceae bacterium]|nr:hypothetical protein [Gaiellaceae bacterium]